MSDQLRLSRSDEFAPKAEPGGGLFEDAYHSFMSQPTAAIAGELVLGAAVLAFSARELLAQGAKAAAALGSLERFGAESSQAERSVAASVGSGLSGAEAGKVAAAGAAELSAHLDAGLFPADARGLRSALEEFSPAKTLANRSAAEGSSGLAGKLSSGHGTIFDRIESESLKRMPRIDFGRFERVVQELPER